MAHLFSRAVTQVEDPKVEIRRIEEEDYHVAITFSNVSEDEEEIIEVLLTADEVRQAHDLVFHN